MKILLVTMSETVFANGVPSTLMNPCAAAEAREGIDGVGRQPGLVGPGRQRRRGVERARGADRVGAERDRPGCRCAVVEVTNVKLNGFGVAVTVGVGVGAVLVGVGVGDGVSVAVSVGVGLGVGVSAVAVGGGGVGVSVDGGSEGVMVGVGVRVRVGVGVRVRVGVGVGGTQKSLRSGWFTIASSSSARGAS